MDNEKIRCPKKVVKKSEILKDDKLILEDNEEILLIEDSTLVTFGMDPFGSDITKK